MQTGRVTVLIISAFLLTACDPAYSIRRENARLDAPTSFDCIRDSVVSTPGVQLYGPVESNPRLCDKNQESKQMKYEAKGHFVTVSTCFDQGNLKRISQSQEGLAGPRKEQEASVVQSKMREVESMI